MSFRIRSETLKLMPNHLPRNLKEIQALLIKILLVQTKDNPSITELMLKCGTKLRPKMLLLTKKEKKIFKKVQEDL